MNTQTLNKKNLLVVSALVTVLAVAGCTKRDQGSLAGAAVGGVLGSVIGKGSGQVLAIALGTAAGAMFGGHLGTQLDEASKQSVARNVSNTLETNPDGQRNVWRDPNRDISSTAVPTRTYQTSSGEYCREYQQQIQIAGQTENAYGKACRQPDGSWKIIG